ncbi:LysR family transcriptional regulator [Gluconacetobacter diazotrophicus]|uniref:Putative transcriptional regulator, LysR family n=1 Tax=Gluconacetobacter diazotrophicus (strain ATCC 49037 / DSM 5601 / CCUG 37298 / CIP 103539 / LMG 7603 / PAl5) TaxID=272568 RepID=A9HQ33_GLUDA|nr:LysR family transcriptional regulator [Gluconacetobacter diazotrophicus]CAP56671.1 putative transcriptional regulator, LysR family [Gluconacetobacter diazotrophicus PA1 5]
MAIDTRLLSGIETLIAVAETGGFTRAAATMGLTPSGVSRAVARLESRLGVRLFDRNARSTTLTEAGHRLVAEVAPLLAGIEEATSSAAGASATVSGRLRVNCDPWFASLLLAPKLRSFLDAHPALTLDLVTRDTLGDLVSEGFDVAIRFGEPLPSGLITRKLLEARIVTCASPAYIARHGRPIHPRDLETGTHECLLFRDPATGRPFDWEFHRQGEILNISVRGRLILNDVATGLAACIAGLGVAQPMTLGIDELLRSGTLIDLFPDWCDEYFPLHVYHPSRHLPPAKVRAFLDFICNDVATVQIKHDGFIGL